MPFLGIQPSRLQLSWDWKIVVVACRISDCWNAFETCNEFGGLEVLYLDIYDICRLLSFLIFSAGGYVVVQEKLPDYAVPELTGFQVVKLLIFYF